MKNVLFCSALHNTLLTAVFAFVSLLSAQAQARIEVFTSDEQPFTLTINGRKINAEPATNVTADLVGSAWSLKVVFADSSLQSIVERIESPAPNVDMQFELIRKKGQYKLKNLQVEQSVKNMAKGAGGMGLELLIDEMSNKLREKTK